MEIKIISPLNHHIQIEKGVTIPPSKLHYSVFPFHKMEVGDSFFVPKDRFKSTSLLQLQGMIYYKMKLYKIDNAVMDMFHFHRDKENNGVRCWRIE